MFWTWLVTEDTQMNTGKHTYIILFAESPGEDFTHMVSYGNNSGESLLVGEETSINKNRILIRQQTHKNWIVAKSGGIYMA